MTTNNPTAELQQLLNISVAHIRKQGRASFKFRPACDGDAIACLYRSPEGLSCAAAPFIREYQPEMESKSFSTIAFSFASALDGLAAAHSEFVRTVLQVPHDSAADRTHREPGRFLAEYERHLQFEVNVWNKVYHTALVVPAVGSDG